MQKKAIVLLSGGIDSTTTLAIAKNKGYECYCLSFNYGQRSIVELSMAKKSAQLFGAAEHVIFELPLNNFGGSALTDKDIKVPDYNINRGIKASYVPARNTAFLSIALAYAETKNIVDIFIGACHADYISYPDCRPEYFEAFTKMGTLGTKFGVEGAKLAIHTPLIQLSKEETITLGTKLGVKYEYTTTCYQANTNNEACGQCEACELRRQAFVSTNIKDPTTYIPVPVVA